MFLKKLMSTALCAALLVTQAGMASAAEETVQGKLAAVEAETWGGEQTGALLDRINRLARDRRDDRKLGLVERRGLGDAHELIAHWRHHWAVESVAHLEAAGPHPLSRELIDNGSHRIIRSG